MLVLRCYSISWASGPLELLEPQQLFDGGCMCVKNNPNNTHTVILESLFIEQLIKNVNSFTKSIYHAKPYIKLMLIE